VTPRERRRRQQRERIARVAARLFAQEGAADGLAALLVAAEVAGADLDRLAADLEETEAWATPRGGVH